MAGAAIIRRGRLGRISWERRRRRIVVAVAGILAATGISLAMIVFATTRPATVEFLVIVSFCRRRWWRWWCGIPLILSAVPGRWPSRPISVSVSISVSVPITFILPFNLPISVSIPS